MKYYVTLLAKVAEIKDYKWELFYKKTLILLYKSLCMRLEKKEILGSNKLILTENCEIGIDDFDRRWEVCCEKNMLKIEESFCLYYSLKHYQQLYESTKKSSFKRGKYIKVFSGNIKKTKYHRFFIGVIILAANMFPNSIKIEGIFPKEYFEDTKLWIEEILNEKYRLEFLGKSGYSKFIQKENTKERFCAAETRSIFKKEIKELNKEDMSILACFAYLIKCRDIRIKGMLDSIFSEDEEIKKDFLKVYISRVLDEILTESAWQRIEKEKNIYRLYLMVAAASVENDNLKTREIKRAVFENVNLFNKLHELVSGGTFPSI